MSTFNFTERTKTIFTRLCKVQLFKHKKFFETMNTENIPSELDDFYSEMEKSHDDNGFYGINKINYNGFIFSICILKKYDCDDDYDHDDDHDHDLCCVGQEINFDLRFNLMFLSGKKLYKENGFSNIEYIFDEFSKWINGLEKTYQACKCGTQISLLDGFCEYCYPYVKKGDDICSICLENDENIWVELDTCKHKFHISCWKNVKEEKCPLCRKKCQKYQFEKI
jgi:hypothetical protein